MPQIRQFNNPVEGLRPDNGMEQVAALNARHVDQEFSRAGSAIGGGIASAGEAYTTVKAQQEISQGMATHAEIADNLSTAWSATINNADPNDHSVGEKFREEQLKPILDAWTTSFSTDIGRKWAEAQAGQLTQHFFEKTAADQAFKSGNAAVENLEATARHLGNMVFNDPTTMDTALGTMDAAIQASIGSNPFLTPETASRMSTELREKYRTQLAMGGAEGQSRINPDAAMKDLAENPKWNELLTPEQRNQQYSLAQAYKREQFADQRSAYAFQKEQQKDDFNQRVVALETQMFQPDGSLTVPPGFHQQLLQLSRHPGASSEPGRIEALENAAAKATRDKIDGTYTQTDNVTWQNLAGRIGLPGGDPRSLNHTLVNQAYAAGKLSDHDYHFLSEAVEKTHNDPAETQALARLNQSLERVKPLVDHSNIYSGKLDQSGIAHYADLHYDVFARYNQLRASGMNATEAERVLEDPRDPRGIQANLGPYQTDNKQGLANLHARVSAGGGPTRTAAPAPIGSAAARKPGESPEAYLARTGGK